MGKVYSENPIHKANLDAAERTRQASASPGSSQAVCKAADLVFARTALASAQANNCGVSQWTTMLKELGTNV
jgi:hypothetical protein